MVNKLPKLPRVETPPPPNAEPSKLLTILPPTLLAPGMFPIVEAAPPKPCNKLERVPAPTAPLAPPPAKAPPTVDPSTAPVVK